MVRIDGKYVMDQNEDFFEFLKIIGSKSPEKISKSYAIITVVKDGNKFSFADSTGPTTVTKTFVVGEVLHEEIVKDEYVKTAATFDGNKLSLHSVDPTGGTLERIYEFLDDGLTITYVSSATEVHGTKHYKRT